MGVFLRLFRVDSHRMKQCRVQTATIAIYWSLIAGLTFAGVADAAPTITEGAASKGDQTTRRFSASDLKERAKNKNKFYIALHTTSPPLVR